LPRDRIVGVFRVDQAGDIGRHGDGIARGKYNQWLFGPKIYQNFKELKALFDPNNIMNPGKVLP